MEMKAKMTSKGQLTLPKQLRDLLGLEKGDNVIIRETNMGYVIEKELDEQRFDKYVGYLKQENSSDRLIEELRGE